MIDDVKQTIIIIVEIICVILIIIKKTTNNKTQKKIKNNNNNNNTTTTINDDENEEQLASSYPNFKTLNAIDTTHYRITRPTNSLPPAQLWAASFPLTHRRISHDCSLYLDRGICII